MEVIVPTSPAMEAHPQFSAPSSPRRFTEFYSYFSAPTSPSRVSEFYRHFEDFSRSNSRHSSTAAVPFDWEETPGTPKHAKKVEDDFAFDLARDSETASRTAEELFDGGKIKPLKLPPAFQFVDDHEDGVTNYNLKSPLLSPRSPRSPKEIIRQVFSPRKRKDDDDPFRVAADNARKKVEEEGGGRRGRAPAMAPSGSRRGTRSLSPYRVSVFPWDYEDEKQNTKEPSPNPKTPPSSSKGSSRRWRLKDFLLFRSKSESHATEKSSFSKYPSFFRKIQEDVKNSSFRSNDSSGSSRRKGPVSAHERYYTTNKAAREDLKKKTSLPYKQGIWGRFAMPRFN